MSQASVYRLERALTQLVREYVEARRRAGLMPAADVLDSHASVVMHVFAECDAGQGACHEAIVLDPAIPTDGNGEFDLADAAMAPVPSVASMLLLGMTADLGDRAIQDARRFKAASETTLIGGTATGNA